MKSYKQYCGVAKALDLVGERWSLLIVRDLLLGPRRYTDLLRGLPGITTNLLARRLQHLQQPGVIEKRTMEVPAASTVYALTARGRQLEAVVLALGAFGEASLAEAAPDDRKDLRYAVLSVRRRFSGSPTPHTIVLEADGGASFTLRLGPSGAQSRDGGSDAADAWIRGPAEVIAPWVVGRAPLADLPLQLEGSAEAVAAFEAGLP